MGGMMALLPPRLLSLAFSSSHVSPMLATQLLTTTSWDPGPYSPWAPAHFLPLPHIPATSGSSESCQLALTGTAQGELAHGF